MPAFISRVLGSRAARRPNLLIEAPHGATTLARYFELAGKMQSSLPADLHTFFTMNTDVGSAELANALAAGWAARVPDAHVVVVRSQIPRTLIDVNRLLEGTDGDLASGALTAAIPPYIDDPSDRALLLDLHAGYTRAVEALYLEVCGAGHRALIVHTYGPRSVGVARVDREIVENLRRVHAPDLVDTWPLRAEIDLITHTPDGVCLAPADWVERAARALAAAGFQVAQNDTYKLAPVAMGSVWAARWPGQTLCFEVRRDLLVQRWSWDQEMPAVPERVARVADALLAGLTG